MSSALVGSSSTMKVGSSTMRARDRDALALAAGEFVRITETGCGIEPDVRRAPGSPAARARLRQSGLVHPEAFLDDVGDRQPRR